MIKTILVDDDYMVRTFMKSMTNWNEQGFEIVADVQDGEQAMEKIREFEPELVITDISMPVMDGIELIKKIREYRINVKIVVLSCHDDFDFVKDAMKYGADDYILKNTFNKKNIEEITLKLKDIINQGREELVKEEELRKMANLGELELKNKFLLNIMKNKHDYGQIKQNSYTYDIELSLVSTAVLLINISFSTPALEQRNEKLGKYSTLRNIIDNVMENWGIYEFVNVNEHLYALIVDGKRMKDKNEIQLIAERIVEEVNGDVASRIMIGVSDKCLGKESLWHAYHHAKIALDCSFYSKEAIYYYQSPRKPIDFKEFIDGRYLDSIRKRKLAGDIESIINKCKGHIKEFELGYVPSGDVIAWIKEIDKVLEIERDNEVYENILSIKDVEHLINTYQSAVHRYPFVNKVLTNPTVAEALDYIVNNYGKGISLNLIADELAVNPTYLSRIFKGEVGMNFTDYLTLYRIEHAKGLLSRTNMKIKDISEKCGFYEYRYFCKVFKKIVGDSPNSYRKESY